MISATARPPQNQLSAPASWLREIFSSLPVGTRIASFVQMAREYVDIGATAVHLEDMGGMISPVTAAKTVAAVKAAVDVPVHYHAHCTGGMTTSPTGR
jgi:pyruvate carboxylase subunit B